MINTQRRAFFWIQIAYWLGIGADALWAIALFIPSVYGVLTGTPDFNPDTQVRSIMAIGGILMTGWTLLLSWAVRKPIERRGVILVASFPVVSGLTLLSLFQVLKGNTFETWILIKGTILIVSMVTSYVLAGKIEKGKTFRDAAQSYTFRVGL